MNDLIFPDDQKTFLENVKEAFKVDLDHGCNMFYQMFLELK